MGLALTSVDWLAIPVADRQAGDGDCLASRRIPALLEMEESALRRSPVCISGSSESRPENDPHQPSIGSSAHSRRTSETRHSDITRNGRQVHGPSQEATFAVVANLSQPSRHGLCFCRFLRRPNDCLPTPIRLRDSRSWPETSDAFRCDL